MASSKKFLLDGNYKLLLEELGVDLSEFLRQSKLPENLFEQVQPMVTADEYYKMWQVLTEYDEEMLIPLKAGMAVVPEMFSPVLTVSLSSANGMMALDRIKKYKKIVAPMVFELEKHETYVDLIIKADNEGTSLPLGLIAFEMVFMNRVLNIGTRRTINPLSVSVTDEIHTKAYAEFFRTVPKVEQINSIRFKRADLEYAFVTRNQAVWSFYEKGLDERLKEYGENVSFTTIVEKRLAELIPSGGVTIEVLASELSLSKRTIQRKLAVENTNFQELLLNVRKKFAKDYLINTNISTKEVAFLLGYEEINSFTRAFKSWTGKTVSEFRD